MIQAFGTLAERLGTVQNREQIGDCLFDFIEQTIAIPYFTVFLFDFDESRLVSVRAKGFTREQQLSGEKTALDRHPGVAFKTGEVVDIPDISQPNDVIHVTSPRSFDPKSCLVIPIMSDDKSLGGLTMASEKTHFFSQEHKEVISSSCNVVGIAYRNLMREQEQQNLMAQLIEAKKEAEIANEEKTLFLANVSHELRTPIHGVRGLIDLSNQTDDHEEKDSYLRFMSQSLGQLQNVVEDLLDVSTLQSGRFVMRRSWFHLQDLIPGVVAEFSALAQQKGLGFKTEMAPPPPLEIQADVSRLRQVLSAILSNAVKYTPSGHITFSAECAQKGTQKELRFSIRDTGMGISDVDLPYIFEPFFRSADESKRSEMGTGLGLAVCMQIIEKLEGEISVSSELGKGSRFDIAFQFPCREAKTEAQSPASDANVLKGRTVLVAEDSKVNQMVISYILQQFGMEVEMCADGQEAWQMSRQKTFDLIVLDLQMPVMDGVTALRAMRADGLTTPTIALTANSDAEEEGECLSAGFQYYGSKPFDTISLKKTMAELILKNSLPA